MNLWPDKGRPFKKPEAIPPNLAELPVKYTLPFEWGSLRVTEAAHEAYHLTPLTAQKMPGAAMEHASSPDWTGPRTDIWLAGPDEAAFGPRLDNDFNMSVQSRLSQQGIAYGMAVDITRENLGYLMVGRLAEESGMDREEVVRNLVDEHGLPIDQLLGQRAPQLLIHMMLDQLATYAAEASSAWLNRKNDLRNYRNITKIGATTLLCSGFISGESVLLEGNVNNFSWAMSAGMTVYGFMAARQMIKRHIDNASTDRAVNEYLSESYARKITSDIHDVYCTKHFDEVAERMFESEPE